SIAPADVGSDLVWKWIDLTSIGTGTASTSYHLVVRRAGSNDAENYYTLGIDTAGGLGGLMLRYNGSTWQSSTFDLAYKIWSAQDTATQLLQTLQDGGQFLRSVAIGVSTGIVTNQY